jgi:flagellar biosynthetic protein FliQ
VTEGIVMQVFYEALMAAFKLAAPALIVSVVVGLIIAIMQAATQVHEQTMTFVPKLVAIALVLLLMGPWMINIMRDFTVELFQTLSQIA